MTAPEKGNWDADFKDDENKSKGNGGQDNRPKTEYMDMTKPGDYKLRLVGPHVKCRKHFKPYRATVQDNEKSQDPAWVAGFMPGKRFAINVIDRADGKLKILEKGASVFKHFANYKSVFGEDPAGKNGPDFLIKVTVPKLPNGEPNKLKTEYTVTHLKEAPFTADEVKMIKEKGLWPLLEIYKSTPADKMKEMWDALPDDKKIAPKKNDDDDDNGDSKKDSERNEKTENAIEKMEEKTVDSPADSKDLFEEEKADEDKDSAELF